MRWECGKSRERHWEGAPASCFVWKEMWERRMEGIVGTRHIEIVISKMRRMPEQGPSML